MESQTEPLDAGYAARIDLSEPPADKPTFRGDATLLKLVDDITNGAEAGWLSTSTMLLEGSAQVQRGFGRYARDLASQVKLDGKHHSTTHIMTDTAGAPCVLVWACCGRDEPLDTATTYLAPYLSAKKHQVGALRASLMVFDATGRQLLRLLFDNRELQHDSELDRSAARLPPLEGMKATAPRPADLRARPRKRGK